MKIIRLMLMPAAFIGLTVRAATLYVVVSRKSSFFIVRTHSVSDPYLSNDKGESSCDYTVHLKYGYAWLPTKRITYLKCCNIDMSKFKSNLLSPLVLNEPDGSVMSW